MTPSPESLVEAKRLIFVLIDEKNAVVGEHIHTTLEECADSIAFALDAARLEAKLEEREACADMLWPIPLGTKYSGTIEGVLEDLSTDIRNRGK